ncbi:ankyrin repeat-containing domain protein [Mariannaea sp. PMI_226]|nr:ankyrin repeat-containing domain protein [Mariannaea sp. PMI_226]
MSQEHDISDVTVQDAPEPVAGDSTHENPVVEDDAEQSLEPDCYPHLREACHTIDLEQVRQILDQHPGLDLNFREPDQGFTPMLQLICSAIMDGETQEVPSHVRLLVTRGASVDIKDAKGLTALHHCAKWNNEVSSDIAKALLDLGANPSPDQRLVPEAQSDTSGDTLNNSCEHSHTNETNGCTCGQNIGEVLKTTYKLATGKELQLENTDKELDVTPLHYACSYGDNPPVAQLLLDHGAKIDVNDAKAGTPLLLAVQGRREEICSMLLSKPGGTVCLSIPDSVGRLPIHHAAEIGNRNLVATLIEAGSLVDPILDGDAVPDRDKGFTPLLFACRNADRAGKIDVVEYLLDHGADAARVSKDGQSPLLLSVLAKNVDVAKLLTQHGANPKAAVGPFEDVNALHMAGASGAAGLCRWLVEEAGLAIDSHDNQGYTALINASGYSGSPETIRMLVATLSANIEARIYDGRRPLHFAAFKGQEATAKELLALGADKEAVDDANWTPLHFAARYHHLEVLRLLLHNGAKVGKKVDGGPQPKRVDGEEFDIQGFTAADLARITRGGQECVDFLVNAGDVLSEETENLKDEDLWEEKGDTCLVM